MSNHIGQELREQMLAKAPPSGALWRGLRLPILILGLGLAANSVAAAGTAGDPSDFISGQVTAALSALANKELTQEDRAKEFHELLDKDFDMLRISRFVLGRYWQEATDAQKQHFLQLFEEYVVLAYSQPLSDFSGNTVRVIGSRPEGETMTLVRSEVVGTDGAPAAKVDWRVRKDEDGFKVIDVDLEGVSIVLTQREQLSSVIERAGGITGLIGQLEQKLGSGSTLERPLAKRE
jgi:phospholipid transport system substrate-binding protein